MRLRPAASRACLLPLLATALAASAQSGGQPANVRIEYAQVLHVDPVTQTLRAYAVEEKCDPPADAGDHGRNCRPVRVEREFKRVVAYDVDYIHRGVKYRSRLPIDPGKRLRVRVSVTPDLPPGEAR